MKLTTLEHLYLKGIIDGKIADYSSNNASTEGLDLNYHITQGKDSAKITFSWNNGKVYKEDETNFAEDKRDDDYFTILASEDVEKLQMYVEELLDRLTA